MGAHLIPKRRKGKNRNGWAFYNWAVVQHSTIWPNSITIHNLYCAFIRNGGSEQNNLMVCNSFTASYLYPDQNWPHITSTDERCVYFQEENCGEEHGEDVFCGEEHREDEDGRSETISRCATTQPASTSSTDGSGDWKEAKKRNNGQNSIISSVFHVWEKGSKNFILGFIGDHSINLDCKF